MTDIGVILFTNDLRIEDNATLLSACAQVDKLICLYCIESFQTSLSAQTPEVPSTLRQRFLYESLACLENSLATYNQYLVVRKQSVIDALAEIITLHNVTHVFSSRHAGWYENHQWSLLKSRYPMIQFEQQETHTLFKQAQLTFDLHNLPDSFSKFRRKTEKKLCVNPPVGKPKSMPAALLTVGSENINLNKKCNNTVLFRGGEAAGKRHLDHYFATELPSTYKQTRNGLDGMDYSTKFSPWLSNGSLSANTIVAALKQYELTKGANESTYWIFFELLWREYFQWYAHHHKTRLYRFGGITNRQPITSFYPQRFQKWCRGTTPFPLVNAFMNQLRGTGYMSNRGRQLVASCFVHELNLDWRYGARFFEQHLVDYDIASNWGNWQYLAGVGADPRGHRKFDLSKQAEIYDPHGKFTQQWDGFGKSDSLDSIDAADWPF